MYRLVAIHFVRDTYTDIQRDKQTDITTTADYTAWQYDRLKINKKYRQLTNIRKLRLISYNNMLHNEGPELLSCRGSVFVFTLLLVVLSAYLFTNERT